MSAFEWREAPPGDYAVIGDPVAHSLSPAMHAAAYQACGLQLAYHAIRIPEAEFDEAMAWLVELGYRGLNVTLPHKLRAWDWADGTDPARSDLAPRAGANTLNLQSKLAVSTDEAGFMASLSDHEFPRKRALICGAGGTAMALAARLAENGFELKLWNRTPGKWDVFASETNRTEVVPALDPAGCDLILNATSATLQGFDLPVDWARAEPDALAYDVAYGKPSPFLESASKKKLTCQDGLRMLMEQGALSFEWWLGISAPRTDMITVLHERTAANLGDA